MTSPSPTRAGTSRSHSATPSIMGRFSLTRRPSRDTLTGTGANRRYSAKERRESMHKTPVRGLTPTGTRGQTGKKADMPTFTLTISDIIRKKRNGERLTPEDVSRFVTNIIDGTMHQAQIGAMLMAIYLRGMNTDETFSLTKALTRSGNVFRWPEEWHRLVVDKHSTGGGGDKISLILAPTLAVCGLKVPMITSRTSEMGTLDKLETIPGIQVKLTPAEIKNVLSSVGCCIVSESEDILPADQLIYKYRDITSTVDSPPLIIASAISKKAAEGLSALVLDVKFGRGSLMKTKEEARNLAYAMVNMGYKMGIKTSAILSSIDSPVGNAIGNALEVAEALQCLKGAERTDIVELAMKLGGELLFLLGATSRKEGAEIISRILREGQGLVKFQDMIIAQGVKPDVAHRLCDARGDMWSVLPRAPHMTTLQSPTTGFVHHIDAFELGRVAHHLGAGRSKIETGVGLELAVKVGSSIFKGQTWIRVYHMREDLGDNFISHLQRAMVVRPTEIPMSVSRVTEIITQH